MAEDPRQLVGSEVAGFRLVAMLGEGGMACVYRGENVLNPSIARAIKIIHSELTNRKDFIERFAREAEILERLQHPRIVRFFGLRRAGEHLLMELELLSGAPLSWRMRQAPDGRLAIGDVVRWVADASEAVAAAHALGFVHRDLKPDNLFITDAGDMKVMDFGIAKVVDETDRATKMTLAGTVPGSPPYLAPEVIQGANPTASADIYAMGITLYEALLGYHPFMPPGQPPKSSAQLMFAHVGSELPKLRERRPDVSPLLEQIALRATARTPDQRYPTARELTAELRAYLTSPTGSYAAVDPAKPVSRTEFAIPQFTELATTTSSAVVNAAPPAPATPPRTGLFVGVAVGLIAIAGGGFAIRAASSHTPAPPAPVDSQHSGVTSPTNPTVLSSVVPESARAGTPAPQAPAAPTNTWVLVRPPMAGQSPLLGIESSAPGAVHGFRPQAGIHAPTIAFSMQQHEVTWGEIEPWLTAHPTAPYHRPAWVPSSEATRASLPATGIAWATASDYCTSIGGQLPTEEQWEWAARGSELRRFPWGDAPLSATETVAYAGAHATLHRAMSSSQDRTSDAQQATPIHDMMGNAQEWTADIYRDDATGAIGDWAHSRGVTYRAVRGYPPHEPARHGAMIDGAAYRESVCAEGTCVQTEEQTGALDRVGFRCVRAEVPTAMTESRGARAGLTEEHK